MVEYKGEEVIIMICSYCNANCKHCYISYDGNFKPDKLEEIINNLKSNGHNILLNGTEPILNKEYFKLYKLCNNNRIFTNGIELIKNPSIMNELLANGINQINLSYHIGIHDDISPVNSKQVEQLIKDLKNNGFIVKIMSTISTKNYKNVENSCLKAYELGADIIKFTNYIKQGNAKKLIDENVLNQEQIDELLEKINILRKHYDKSELVIERCGSFGNYPSSNFICTAGSDSVVMTPSFDIYPCVFNAEKGSEIGKYIDDKIYLFDDVKTDKTKCLSRKQFNGF